MEKSKEFQNHWSTPIPSDKYPTLEMWHLSVFTDDSVEKALRLAQLEDASEIMLYFKNGIWTGYCLVQR